MPTEKDDRSYERALSELVDKRIAEIFGLDDIRTSDELLKEPGVMSTPSVLSIVRATAYAHC